jgi:N-acetyl-gamma-glutamyl-phosphate reductase
MLKWRSVAGSIPLKQETGMYKIFIDGQAGTTGLQIHERLQDRADIEILAISDAHRKDTEIKRQIIEAADVVILCLPDDAARETVQLAPSNKARFIDASTAHRIHPEWVYGLPELNNAQRSQIQSARLVSNPGCYPTGFLLAIAPLVEQGLLKLSSPISVSAVSGYSGGGRQMMEEYQQRKIDHPDDLWHVRPYALQLAHKHIPEMKHYAHLEKTPLFMPYVGHFAQGMLVSIGLFKDFFTQQVSPEKVHELLESAFRDEPCINVYGPNEEAVLEGGFLEPQLNNGTNRLDIFVYGQDDQILIVSRLDNLGKGAAGAAVQNLNLMLGTPELEGLIL